MSLQNLPVAVIGAGPVGLAAAAHLIERGIAPAIFEAGDGVGATIREWSHVRVFTPWSLNVDAAAGRLLAAAGWQAPDPDAIPTGGAILRRYLEPLAALPAMASALRLGARVTSVTRRDLDKMSTRDRAAAPFVIAWTDRDGRRHRSEARAVIDASGTWRQPNPLGVDGLPVPGEREAAGSIAYGIPDVYAAERNRYAGRRVLVVGSGHSAINVALDLLRLQAEVPATRIIWALRRDGIARLLGGGLDDRLAERGALGLAAKMAIDSGRLDMRPGFATDRIEPAEAGLRVMARQGGRPVELEVDRIVVATGFRPDLGLLGELRVAVDPTVEAPPALAPLIDPNLHSCGTVPPHGAAELAQPEPNLYVVGAKSYGRAPTFLMATGYEQVRSVVAAIAGDVKAAREVHLVLPETGVCSAANDVAAGVCCGGPVPAAIGACCITDLQAKAAGADGCGCGGKVVEERPVVAASSCCGGPPPRPVGALVGA